MEGKRGGRWKYWKRVPVRVQHSTQRDSPKHKSRRMMAGMEGKRGGRWKYWKRVPVRVQHSTQRDSPKHKSRRNLLGCWSTLVASLLRRNAGLAPSARRCRLRLKAQTEERFRKEHAMGLEQPEM